VTSITQILSRPAFGLLQPRSDIGDQERARAVTALLIDAGAATAIGALNSGVVLLALALHIGASNIQIGFLAAIPLLTQVLQAPAVKLVEKVRQRRLISVCALFLARLGLLVYATVPFIPERNVAAATLIFAAFLHYGFNAVAACSWNSWIRDLIPGSTLGRFSSGPWVSAPTVSAAATLKIGGAWCGERWKTSWAAV